MMVAGGELSLMNAMISTGQNMRLRLGFLRGGNSNDSPIIIESTVFFPSCGQSRVRGEPGSEMDRVGWTDQLETSHKTEVQIGGMIAWQRICPGVGGTP